MTTTDRDIVPVPPGARVEVLPEKRGPLRTIRDVLACVFFALASVLMILMLIFGGAVAKGISDVQNDLNSPDPISTCLGEEPC